MGVTAAFISSAEMLHFPVAGGMSGHFLMAMFSSVLLGPWTSLIIITTVLVVQCLGFADGELTALGSNIFNMGVIDSLAIFLIALGIGKLIKKSFSQESVTAPLSHLPCPGPRKFGLCCPSSHNRRCLYCGERQVAGGDRF